MTMNNDDKIDWEAVIKSYYNDRVVQSRIVEDFQLPVLSKIYECFPKYVHSDKCIYCSSPYYSDFLSRDIKSFGSVDFNLKAEELELIDETENKSVRHAFAHGYSLEMRDERPCITSEYYKVSFPYCSNCGHKPSITCDCKNCEEVKNNNFQKILKEKTIEIMAESAAYDVSADDKEISQLSVAELFYSLLLVSRLNKENSENIALDRLPDEQKEYILHSDLLEIDKSSIANAIDMLAINVFVYNQKKIKHKLKSSDKGKLLEDLKYTAFPKISDDRSRIDIVNMWSEFAISEALSVLKHYCNEHGIRCHPGEKTLSIIQRSLNYYGLALTCRYICNSVRRAEIKGNESGCNYIEKYKLVYQNLSFWIDNPVSKEYAAIPFYRGVLLEEPFHVSIFSHAFLEPHQINYFSDPIQKIMPRYVSE